MGKKQKGMSLIEIMTVIAIIILLTGVAVYNFAHVRAKSRDSKRIADISQIQKAINLYYDRHNEYPPNHPEIYDMEELTGQWATSEGPNGDRFLEDLVTDGFLDKSPTDPIDRYPYAYRYYRYAGECDGENDNRFFYVLGIEDMETVKNFDDEGIALNQIDRIHPSSPGWSCSYGYGQKDWHDSFEWVTGSY